MLTLTAEALAQLRRGAVDPVWRVDFGDDITAGVPGVAWIASFSSGDRDISDDYQRPVPPLVADASGLAQSIETLTGAYTNGSVTVELLDHRITRDLVELNRILGKDLVLWFGFPDATGWAYADWIPAFRGIVTGWEFGATLAVEASSFDLDHPPSLGPATTRGATIPRSIPIGLPITDTLTGWDHYSSDADPLTCMYQMLWRIAGVPTRFIDATSFDPTTPANDYLSHLRVSKVADKLSDRRVSSPIGIWDAMREIAFLCRGFVRFDESGAAVFQRIDLGAAHIATWGTDDLAGEPERPSASQSDIVSATHLHAAKIGEEAGTGFLGWSSTDNDYQAEIILYDAGQETAWGFSGDPAPVALYREVHVHDEWFGATGANRGAWSAALPDTLDFHPLSVSGMATGMMQALDATDGYGWPGLGASVASVSPTRPIYLAIVDPATDGFCVVSFTGLTVTSTGPTELQATGGVFVGGDAAIAAAANNELAIHDVTAVYLLGQQLLDMHGDTAARVSVRTRLNCYPVQVGDFVRLSTNRYLDFGFDGDPGTTNFMVLSKDIDPEDWSITWELKRIRSTSPSLSFSDVVKSGRDVYQPPEAWSFFGDVFGQTGRQSDAGFDPHVEEGFIGPTSVNLAHTIQAGWAGIAGWLVHGGGFVYTYLDNSDTWVFLSGGSYQCSIAASFTFTNVATGAARPAGPANSIALMRVRTSGGAITEVLDLRNTHLVGNRSVTDSQNTLGLRAEILNRATVDGFEFAPVAGLVQTIPAGTAYVDGGERVERVYDEAHTFTATRDTYVDIGDDGTLYYTAQAVGADEPVLSVADRHRLMMVRTDAANVTSVDMFPRRRAASSRAIAPQAMGTAFAPNALLDDHDIADNLQDGWTATISGAVTIRTSSIQVKAGRYTIDLNVPGGVVGSSYLRSDLFAVWPRDELLARVSYATGAYARAPLMSIGLEYFDRWLQSLGTRNMVIAAGVPGDDATDQGGVLEALITGFGAADTQIPPTARWARWVIRADSNPLGGGGVYLSLFQLEPATGRGFSTPYILSVGSGLEYATVEAALAAAAGLGLTDAQNCIIRVAPGTYSENNPLVVPDFTFIRGAGGDRNAVKIEAQNAANVFNHVWPYANYWGLSNLTIDGDGTALNGVNQTRPDTCYLTNVRIIGCVTGIYNINAAGIVEAEELYTDNSNSGINVANSTSVVRVHRHVSRDTNYALYSNGIIYAWDVDYDGLSDAVITTNANSRFDIFGGVIQNCTNGVSQVTANGAIIRLHGVRFVGNTTDILFDNVTGVVLADDCEIDSTKITLGVGPGTLYGHYFDPVLNRWFRTSALDMDGDGTGTNPIHNVTDPAAAQDAATKAYVDAGDGAQAWPDFIVATVAELLAALGAAVVGEAICVEPGTYTLAAAITIPDGVTLFSTNPEEVVITGAFVGNLINQVTAWPAAVGIGAELQWATTITTDLAADAGGVAQGDLVDIQDAAGPHYQTVMATAAGNPATGVIPIDPALSEGIAAASVMTNVTPNRNWKLSGVTLRGDGANVAFGLRMDGFRDVRVEDVRVEDCTVADTDGVHIRQGLRCIVEKLLLDNCLRFTLNRANGSSIEARLIECAGTRGALANYLHASDCVFDVGLGSTVFGTLVDGTTSRCRFDVTDLTTVNPTWTAVTHDNIIMITSRTALVDLGAGNASLAT